MKCDYCSKKVELLVEHGKMKICKECSELLNYMKIRKKTTVWKGIEIALWKKERS